MKTRHPKTMMTTKTKNKNTDNMSEDCRNVAEISSIATSTFFKNDSSRSNRRIRTNRSNRNVRTKLVDAPDVPKYCTYDGNTDAKSIKFFDRNMNFHIWYGAEYDGCGILRLSLRISSHSADTTPATRGLTAQHVSNRRRYSAVKKYVVKFSTASTSGSSALSQIM